MIPGKTYQQLYWDKGFIELRIKEQNDYISDVQHSWAIGNISLDRANLLYNSARGVLTRLRYHLENIKKLE